MKFSKIHQFLFVTSVFFVEFFVCSDVTFSAASQRILENLDMARKNKPNEIKLDFSNSSYNLGVTDKFSRIDLKLSHSIIEYLENDPDALRALFSTSIYFNYIVITLRLSNFSPYLIFNESWMNKMMYKVLNIYYYQSNSINDLNFHDLTALAKLNFILQ